MGASCKNENGSKRQLRFRVPPYEPDASGEVECCIEKAVMDLLSLCVFSGIVITYAAPGFPLYYIDERMLALLDYSSQAELIAANGQAMINCIRPEDRMGRQAEIAQALLNGTCYTTTYRMMCRDRGISGSRKRAYRDSCPTEHPCWSVSVWILPGK